MSNLYVVAHIKNGVVENTCVWDKLPSEAQSGDYVAGFEYVNITDSPVGIGWEYSSGVFVHPEDPSRSWVVPTEPVAG